MDPLGLVRGVRWRCFGRGLGAPWCWEDFFSIWSFRFFWPKRLKTEKSLFEIVSCFFGRFHSKAPGRRERTRRVEHFCRVTCPPPSSRAPSLPLQTHQNPLKPGKRLHWSPKCFAGRGCIMLGQIGSSLISVSVVENEWMNFPFCADLRGGLILQLCDVRCAGTNEWIFRSITNHETMKSARIKHEINLSSFLLSITI